MRALRIALPALVTIGLRLAGVNGAAQIATATLAGEVRDETGGALPGVTVTVRSAATAAVRTATTDSAGRYRVAALDPGEYEVRTELANFRPVARTGVILTVGGTTEADITMSLGAITEGITVISGAPLIETSAVEMSRVVTTAEIESLPISGRNFVDFVKLSSGVAVGRENVGGGAFKESDVGVGSAAAPGRSQRQRRRQSRRTSVFRLSG